MDSAGKSSTVIDSHCPVIVAVSEITHSFVSELKLLQKQHLSHMVLSYLCTIKITAKYVVIINKLPCQIFWFHRF